MPRHTVVWYHKDGGIKKMFPIIQQVFTFEFRSIINGVGPQDYNATMHKQIIEYLHLHLLFQDPLDPLSVKQWGHYPRNWQTSPAGFQMLLSLVVKWFVEHDQEGNQLAHHPADSLLSVKKTEQCMFRGSERKIKRLPMHLNWHSIPVSLFSVYHNVEWGHYTTVYVVHCRLQASYEPLPQSWSSVCLCIKVRSLKCA